LYPLCSQRLSAVVTGESEFADDEKTGSLDRVIQYTCPSLPHFIALLCRPTETSVPPGTSLIVVDSLSALLNHSFPRVPDQKASKIASKGMMFTHDMSQRSCSTLTSCSSPQFLSTKTASAPAHYQRSAETCCNARSGNRGAHTMRIQDAARTGRERGPSHQRWCMGSRHPD
jgi:hypothetical protein